MASSAGLFIDRVSVPALLACPASYLQGASRVHHVAMIDDRLMLQDDRPGQKAPRHRTDCGTRLSLWVS